MYRLTTCLPFHGTRLRAGDHPAYNHVSSLDHNRLTFSKLGLDGALTLNPSATVFHYAQCLFEGLKAYRNKKGMVTLFRPDLNMARMNRSAERIALPASTHILPMLSYALRSSC